MAPAVGVEFDLMGPNLAGNWFAIPLRFGLFAVGRAVAVDERGAVLGYFFAQFFERLPTSSDTLALTPGDASIIGMCTLRGCTWPVIANDPRGWTIPIFREIERETGRIRWQTFTPTNLMTPVTFDHEPKEAGTRNWGLPMIALKSTPMTWVFVEFALWRHFRVYQNGKHRKYIADLQRKLAMAR